MRGPGAVVRTEWRSPDIWLRRSFTLPDVNLRALSLSVHHDEDAEVYLNGVLAARLPGFGSDYDEVTISDEARAAASPRQEPPRRPLPPEGGRPVHRRRGRGGKVPSADATPRPVNRPGPAPCPGGVRPAVRSPFKDTMPWKAQCLEKWTEDGSIDSLGTWGVIRRPGWYNQGEHASKSSRPPPTPSAVPSLASQLRGAADHPAGSCRVTSPRKR